MYHDLHFHSILYKCFIHGFSFGSYGPNVLFFSLSPPFLFNRKVLIIQFLLSIFHFTIPCPGIEFHYHLYTFSLTTCSYLW
jgi:hypothetical protein